ncbi:MAG: FAD-dependent monooxygenase [Comamonadaceae bacterium]
MQKKIVIVGGGIGGLSTALACGYRDLPVQLIERNKVFSEVGAGIQISPNIVRLLEGWGLKEGLDALACFPSQLEIRSALSADLLGRLPLGERAVKRYGARYATIARSDLHGLLLKAVNAQGSTQLIVGNAVEFVSQDASAVTVTTADGQNRRANVLIGADGLWSQVRDFVRLDAQPQFSGYVAYRAMVAQADLPETLRSQVITAWLGPDFHAVQYPVHHGELLNVAIIVKATGPAELDQWNQTAEMHELQAHLANAAAPLQELVSAISKWNLWPLCGLPKVRSAQELAFGRIALLGDAAHPMLPFLGQGAGMAIEDAFAMADVLQQSTNDDADALERFARRRWKRNARVQARAVSNGEIFHATGLRRWGRDTAMKLFGARMIDVPWLYRGR